MEDESQPSLETLQPGTWVYRVDVPQPRGAGTITSEHTGKAAQSALNEAMKKINQQRGRLIDIVEVNDRTGSMMDSFLLVVHKGTKSGFMG
jgi:hypothetical protein